MQARVEDVRHYKFQRDENLFFDANVWLHIYGPNPPSSGGPSRVYSSALRDMRMAGCRIFIDVLVMSEFVNSYARREYAQSGSGTEGFKAFRRSESFKPIALDISVNAKRIFTMCQAIDSAFAATDIVSLLTDFGAGNHDFNDQMIRQICLANNLKLVTDDTDFADSDLVILSANPQLIED